MHAAAQNGNLTTVNTLIEQGADLSRLMGQVNGCAMKFSLESTDVLTMNVLLDRKCQRRW